MNNTLWPECDVCRKPVERMEAWQDDRKNQFIIVVECHGARERVEINIALLHSFRPHEMSAGRAFVKANAALPSKL